MTEGIVYTAAEEHIEQALISATVAAFNLGNLILGAVIEFIENMDIICDLLTLKASFGIKCL